MFKNKKLLKEIEIQKQELEYEKQQLLFIKQQLEESSPKVDITDVYIFEKKGIYSLVKLHIKNIVGNCLGGAGILVNGYQSTLVDLFSNEIVFEKCSVNHISEDEIVKPDGFMEEKYHVYIYPLYKFDHNLLAYPDKKVPLYVLQQLYYNINNVNLNSPVLKKQK